MLKPFALAKTIGSAYRNDPDDTLTTKRALQRLGFYAPPEWGITHTADDGMIDGLKAFQEKNRIAADGVMTPGGPTKRLIETTLWEQDNATAARAPVLRLAAAVGEDSPNRATDVRAAKRALALAGFDSAPASAPGTADREFLGNIDLFQRAFNLKRDGKIAPDGKSKHMLARLIRPAMSEARGGEPERPSRKATRPTATKVAANETPEDIATDLGLDLSDRHEELLQHIAIPQSTASRRKNAILNNKPTRFTVSENPNANDGTALHEFHIFSEVKENDATIKKKAKEVGVDPDFVRAIMYMETTRGRYDVAHNLFDVDKSVRPMNINVEEWKSLGFNRKELNDPENNIEAGVKLIKKIQDRMPGASIEQLATVYNSLGATEVTDYGARVGRIYRERLWEK